MRRVTEYLLLAYVFSVPWDFATLPGLGPLARLLGVMAVIATGLTVVSEGRFRKPDSIALLATAFVAMAMLSTVWTASSSATYQAASTYAQLLASLWVVREIARTRDQYLSLVRAFCLGMFVPMAGLVVNFAKGVNSESTRLQYTADGLNADAMGLLVVLALPLAWHLVLAARSSLGRALPLVYLGLAPIAVLLTAVRGAFLAGAVALLVIPLTVEVSLKTAVRSMVLLSIVCAGLFFAVPRTSWERMATIPGEIGGGSLSARRGLWKAGLAVFPEHPILGFGAGAYATAISGSPQRPLGLKPGAPAHSVPVGLLVEQGIIGVLLLLALAVACVRGARALPRPERAVWLVILAVMLVGSVSGSLERWKVTWLLLGLLAARAGASRVSDGVPAMTHSTARRAYPIPAFAASERSAAARVERW